MPTPRPLPTVAALALWLVCLLVALPSLAAEPVEKAGPNILYVLADDLGRGDLSCYNPGSAWRTPRLDRLAAEGMLFTDAHAASGVCTPSRYTLLTGRSSWRGKLKAQTLRGYSESLIEPGRMTVADFLRNRGYTTAVFGKWHLGVDWPRTGPNEEDVDLSQPFGGGPLAHGFDRFLGISASLDMPPYVWLAQDRIVTLPTGQIADSPLPKYFRGGPISPDFTMEGVEPTLIDTAAEYLTERAAATDGKPFFLYLPLAAPHTPIVPVQEFVGRTQSTDYGDFVAQVDADVGRLLDVLERTGLAPNTLVVFSSDNGFSPAANLPALEALGHDPSAGLRGYKTDLYEGGHRVPLVVRWPGQTPAGSRSDQLVCHADLLATCADLLDATLPADAAEDSFSMLPLLRGQAEGTRKSCIMHSSEGRFAIREGRWKLHLWPGSGGWSPPTPTPSLWLEAPVADLSQLAPFQLFDLEDDPAETTNLAATQPEIVARLGKLLRAQIDAGRSTPGPAQPVNFADWPEVAWREQFAP